jgi:hypothetical protein
MDWNKYAGNLDVSKWGHANIPLDGLALWLDASSITPTTSDISEWKDLSTNNFKFTSSGTDRPTLVENDADWNNRPYLAFDGNDKMSLSFDAALNTNQFSLFVVCTVDSDDNTHHSIIENSDLAGLGTGNKGWVMTAVTTSNNGNNDMYQMRTGTGGSPTLTVQNTATGTLVPNTPGIVSFTLSGGNGAGANATKTLFYNGIQSPVTGTAGGQLTAPYYKHASAQGYDIGNDPTYQLTGQLAEVIQYNRALTANERKYVEDYLADKYAVSMERTINPTSNPYQDITHPNKNQNSNQTDNNIQFLYRPAFGLDFKHSQMFRSYVALKGSSPQENSNFYRATAGGKYGFFTSEAPGARVGAFSSPPYAPVYTVDPDTSTTVPVSQGPVIPGVDVTGYDKSDITNPVARMVMSENTLEHFRADASRRSIDDDEGDYSVQPRHSQTLHPKGSKGDASYNTGDHSGE